MKIFSFKIIISIAVFVLFPAITFAAALYFEPADGNYYQGDTFINELRVDAQDECINTVKASLSFPQDLLEVVDFSRGNSILAIWLEEAEISEEEGLISFTGGIPGGYCGVLPGDPGKSNLLAKIIFKVKAQGPETARVRFLDDTQVLLNDGFGTPAELETQEGVFNILSGIPETTKKEWQEELMKDDILPESFEVEVSQDPSIFNNKYFIAFSTVDKQTGVDYYQVKEGKRDWKTAENPYLLEDQSLTSIIKVRAVDKAGNERIVEQSPLQELPPWWVVTSILLAVGILWWVLKRFSLIQPK